MMLSCCASVSVGQVGLAIHLYPTPAERPSSYPVFDKSEFISYATLEPDKFLARLENALQSIIGNPCAAAYPEAVQLFQEFVAANNLAQVRAGENDFVAAAIALRANGQLLPATAGRPRTEFLIRRLLGVEPAIDVLVALKGWLDQKYQ